MRFGINLVNWVPGWTAEALPLVGHVARLGYTAVEIPLDLPTLPDLAPWRRELQANGLEAALCVCMLPGRDLSSFDPAVREGTKQYLRECLKTGEAFGAKVLCGPLYTGGGKRHRLPPAEKQREWQLAVEGLRELAPVAESCGMRLALEPLHRYRTSVVNRIGQALQMVADINHPAVGVHFDTYHANIEENDVVAALQTALQSGRLFHLHFSENQRGAPGTGHLPWPRLAAAVKAAGYTGHVTVESFCDEAALDECWYPLAESPDALARTGLANLQAMFQ